MSIYLAQKVLIALFIAAKVTIFKKYANFDNIFLKKMVKILSKQTNIKKYAIKLENVKQLSYEPI